MRRLDLGGGLGIHYDFGVGADVGECAAIVKETVSDLNCELTVERDVGLLVLLDCSSLKSFALKNPAAHL